MKAKIKATGEIVDVEYNHMYDSNGVPPYVQRDENGEPIARYIADQLSWDIYDLDYWEKLKHQAAVSAMQGMLSNPELFKATAKNAEEFGLEVRRALAIDANVYATTLVEKLKEEK